MRYLTNINLSPSRFDNCTLKGAKSKNKSKNKNTNTSVFQKHENALSYIIANLGSTFCRDLSHNKIKYLPRTFFGGMNWTVAM